MSAIAMVDKAGAIEAALVEGDLSKLTVEERVTYYMRMCESIGLNPSTKPFEYIKLNGKLVLYAVKGCTDQLRSIRRVSIAIVAREMLSDVYVVTARATLPDGRTDESTGVVTVGNLKGDNLANALMKAETKAKRRVTLSACGLGLLDESEVETIPSAQPIRELAPVAAMPRPTVDNTQVNLWVSRINYAETIEQLEGVRTACKEEVTDTKALVVISEAYRARKKELESL